MNLEYEEWFAKYQTLLGWIYNTIESTVALELMVYESSKQLWEAINDLFEIKRRSNIVFTKENL